MDDTTLAGYIPIYGDRIAARRFCLQHSSAKTKESAKHSMLEKLKKKMGIAGSDDDTNNLKTEKTLWKTQQMGRKKDKKSGVGMDP